MKSKKLFKHSASETVKASFMMALTLSWTVMPSTALLAAPTGEQVIAGNASFHRDGALTQITAANNTIINYQSFDIGSAETVQFIQPGANASVLNRVTATDNPTQILGTLTANGQVYLVNPAGITFGQNAYVDVGALFAAAGNMSNEDYLNGLNNFSGLEGRVENWGTIQTSGINALIGRSVANYGSLFSSANHVVLVSGDQVLLGERDGHVFVEIASPTPSVETGVENAGTVSATEGDVLMASGDALGIAILQSGWIEAKNVDIDGSNGEVEFTGNLELTADNAKAEMRGETVTLSGANISSGAYSGADFAVYAEHVSVDANFNLLGGHVLIDPAAITIDNTGAGDNITAATIVSVLNAGADFTVEASDSITVDAAINSTGGFSSNKLVFREQAGSDNTLVINLNAAITMDGGETLQGGSFGQVGGTTVNVSDSGLIANAVNLVETGGTIDLSSRTVLDLIGINDLGSAGVLTGNGINTELVGTGGDDTFNLFGGGSGSVSGGISFNGITSIDASAGMDSVSTNADTALTGTSSEATTHSVTVSNFENLTSTNGNLVGTNGADENFNLTGANSGDVNGIDFGGITAINAGTSTGDSLRTNAITTLTGTAYEATTHSVTVSNLETLSATNGALNGSANTDSFTLTSSNAGTANSIAFSDVTIIDAAGGSDSLSTNAGTSINGVNAVTTNSVFVSNFESLDANSNTLTGTAGAEAFILTGANAGSETSSGISFTEVASINAGGGDDTLDFNSGATYTAAFSFDGGSDANSVSFSQSFTTSESLTLSNIQSFAVATGGTDDLQVGGILDVNTTGVINIATAGTFNAGSLRLISAAGDITVFEDSNMLISRIDATIANDVTLFSAGSINGANFDGVADVIGRSVSLTANSGGIGTAPAPLEVTVASTTLNADTTFDNSDIVIAGIGDLDIGLVTAGNGDVTLNSTGDINGVTDDGVADVVGSTITLVADSDDDDASGIGETNTLDVTASIALNADTNNTADGNIVIDSIGDLPVGLVDAGTGNVTLASTGSITDADNGLALDIIAGTAALSAGSNIGSGDGAPSDTNVAALNIAVDIIEAVAGSDIYLESNQALTIGGAGTIVGLEGTTGVVKLKSSGTITVAEAVQAGMDVLLLATSGDITQDANVTATAGNVSLIAFGKIDQSANIAAGADAYADAQGGSVLMTAGTQTTADNVRYSATDDIALGFLAATDSVSVVAGVDAGDDITDVNANETANISGARGRLSAGGSIGSGVANVADANLAAVDIAVANVEAQAGTDIYLQSSQAVSVGGVGDVLTNYEHFASGVAAVTDLNLSGLEGTSGVVKLKSAGTITLAETLLADLDVLLLATTGGVTANGSITSTAGDLTVTGADFALNNTLSANELDTTGVTAGSNINLANVAGLITFTGNGIETITGTGSDEAFVLNGANAGSVGGLDFSGVSAIDGGTSLSDSVTGSANSETFDLSGDESGTVNGISFSEIETLNSSGGGDNYNIIASLTRNLQLGADGDTVTIDPSFTLDGSVTGGAGADALEIGTGSSITGEFDGQGGDDTLSYAGNTGSIAVDLQTNSATGTGGISSVEDLIGNGTDTTLSGTSGADTFAITGVDSGTVAGLSFSAVTDLAGEAGNDTFDFADTGSVSGTVSGGVDSDTLDFADEAGVLAFVITGANTGTVAGLSFSAIESLIGGGGNDTLDFNSAATFTAPLSFDGGSGNNAVSFSQSFSINSDLTLSRIDNFTAASGAATENLTVLGNLNINTPGSIVIGNGGTFNAGSLTLTSTGANLADFIIVTESSDMLIDRVAALSDVSLSASGAIDSLTDDATADVIGEIVNLTAAAGGIGTNSIVDVTATAALNANTVLGDDGNILIDGIGDLPVGLVDAGIGDVSLNSTGSIIEFSGGNNIAADYLRLEAIGSIGSAGAGNALDTNVNTVASTSGVNTYLLEANAITVDDTGSDLGGLRGALTRGGEAGGVYKLETTNGSMTVAAASVADAIQAGSHILLNAGGAGSDVTLDSGADVVSTGAGSISLLAQDAVTLNADLTTAGGTVDVEAFDSSLTMASGKVVTSNGGNIRYAASGAIALGLLNAGTGDVSVLTDGGFITEATAGNNIAADYLRLEASGSIGAAGAGNALDTNVNTVASKSGTNTYLLEANAITVDDTGSSGITVQRVGLDSTLTATTDVALDRGGEAGGVYQLETTNGSITVAAASVAEAIQAVNLITLNAGGAGSNLTQNAGASITSTGGNLSLTASSTITGGGGGSVDIVADLATLTAGTGIDLNTTVTSVDATVTGAGDIVLSETDGITLTDVDTNNGLITVTAGGAITATDVASLTDSDANDISLLTTGAGILVTSVTAGTLGDVTLDAQAGSITNNGGVDVVADVLTADATNAIDLDTTVTSVDASVSGTGNIVLDETDGILLTDVDTANGSIAVTAGGSITATDVASLADADGNDISLLTTGGDILATSVNAGSNHVSLTSNGAIIDGGDANIDIVAGTGTLMAETGIGVGNALETTLTTLTAINNTSGSIEISETDNLDINTVENGDRTVIITAGGTITGLEEPLDPESLRQVPFELVQESGSFQSFGDFLRIKIPNSDVSIDGGYQLNTQGYRFINLLMMPLFGPFSSDEMAP